MSEEKKKFETERCARSWSARIFWNIPFHSSLLPVLFLKIRRICALRLQKKKCGIFIRASAIRILRSLSKRFAGWKALRMVLHLPPVWRRCSPRWRLCSKAATTFSLRGLGSALRTPFLPIPNLIREEYFCLSDMFYSPELINKIPPSLVKTKGE